MYFEVHSQHNFHARMGIAYSSPWLPLGTATQLLDGRDAWVVSSQSM